MPDPKTENDTTHRRNISWLLSVDEVAEDLAKDLKYESVSAMLSDFVLKASKNPEIFGELKAGARTSLRSLIQEMIQEMQSEAGASQKQGMGKIRQARGKKA